MGAEGDDLYMITSWKESQSRMVCWKPASITFALNLKLCIQGTHTVENYCNNIMKGLLWENPHYTHKYILFVSDHKYL